MTARSLRPWAWLGAIAVAAAVAYAPSFRAPFQFDDYARIIDNEALHQGHWLAALYWLGSSRVLPSLTLMANYIVGGDRVLGYHVVNFALHLLAALGVFVLARLLCRAPRLRRTAAAEHPLLVAYTAALITACHPLQTQAVTYIIQRAAVMSALFYVWAVVCYVRGRLAQIDRADGRAGRWFAAAIALGAAALLSKENAVSLPLALLLAELVVIGGRPRPRALAIGAAVFAALLLLPVIWKVATWTVPLPASPRLWPIWFWNAVLAQGTDPSAATPYTYFLTQFLVVPRYLGLTLLPWGLNVDHDVPLVTVPTPAVLAGLGVLAALFALGLAAVRRAPVLGFGVLWIFVALSVESSVLPISDVMMEHRMYLAMPGVAVAVGAALAWVAERRPALATATVGLLAVAMVGLTFTRNLVWQSPVSLWLDAAEKSSGKGRVLVNYGVALHGAGQLDAAARQYCRAIALDPELTLAHDNLELALDQMGKLDAITAKAVPVPAPKGSGLPPGAVILEVDIPGTYCPGVLGGS